MPARKKKRSAKKATAKKAPEGVAATQAAIKTKGFDWEAGRTSVSDLPDDQQRTLLGYRANEKELDSLAGFIKAANAFQTNISTGIAASPAAVDWRNNNGNWMTPIRDQQSCGSCVSFATLATVEARVKIECRNASLQPDYSEAFLFFCGCGNCCGTGWNFAPSLDFCRDRGIATEASWPYQPQNQPCRNVPTIGKITSWKRALSMDERFESIARHGPMVAGMRVYADFMIYKSGIYRRTSNVHRGYHAICVVGYDKRQRYWICKNSWGTNWGESGYFRIGFGESEIDTRFPFYEVMVPCLKPVDGCRRYVPYLVRVLRVARTNPRFRRCLRYYVCRRGWPGYCPPAYLRVIRSVLAILRRCPQYRRPFCNALR